MNRSVRKTAVVIAVVAKCPIAGQCKTRLRPYLDDNGCATLALAMLLDVLISIMECSKDFTIINSNDDCPILDHILYYAPPTEDGRRMMETIVSSSSSCHNLQSTWTLLPVNYNNTNELIATSQMNYGNERNSSMSSNLSNILTNVLRTAYHRHINVPTTTILFGMDAPEIPMNELKAIIKQQPSLAFLCPAYDGGYVMLSIPPIITSDKSRNKKIDYIF